MTTRCPFSDPQDPVSRVSNIRGQGPVVDGPAHHALLQAAQHADLLVLGVRHRHGIVHRELRPTHHAALRHSPCPVALVGVPWPN
ncbi:universal stress protein [Streptomyces sp. For3]|nr:universal stress protein [Streptomyces silvae]